MERQGKRKWTYQYLQRATAPEICQRHFYPDCRVGTITYGECHQITARLMHRQGKFATTITDAAWSTST
jgi:hypothetical protein